MSVDLDPAVRAAVQAAIPELRAAVVEAVRASLNDRLLSVDDAALVVGCSPMALRKKIARGNLPAVRHGRSVRVRLSDLLGQSVPAGGPLADRSR